MKRTRETDGNLAQKAMAILAERGWHQGDFRDAAGRVCFFGALNLAAGYEVDHGVNAEVTRAGEVAEVIVREQFPDRFRPSDFAVPHVVEFNDHEDTTVEDVLLVLEKTAAALDEGPWAGDSE